MASEQTHKEFMTSTKNQQPTGKGFGVRYTFPYDVYPRYSYLQSWTARLVSRFRQKIETNGLQECVSNGYGYLEEITAAEKCLEKPTVTLFSKRKSLVRDHQKYLVATSEPLEYDKPSANVLVWNDLVNEGNVSSAYDSRVLVVITKDTDKDMFEKLSGLSQVQQESTLIYNPCSKSHHFYKTKRSDLEIMNNSTKLSHAIQAVLELKVVTFLEKIATYMEPLVPRDGLEPDTSMLEVITDKLKQFEICNLRQVINLNKKSLTKKYEYQHGDSQGRNQKASIRSPANILFSLPLQKDQIEELIKVIGRKTKCQIVDHLMMEFGISCNVLNTFLSSEKFFDFDTQYGSWIKEHEIDKLDTAETILSKSGAMISHLLYDIADYVRCQYEHLEGIQKQQFELFGILRQSVFDVKEKMQIKLTPELRDEILSLEEVIGCGTIFGILTLHVFKELTKPSKDSLKQLRRKYNYYRRYSVQVVSMQENNHIQSGSMMLAEIKDDMKEPPNNFKCGTIGCFVFVEEIEQILYERISRGYLEETNISKGLHCITCRHCVADCKDIVTTRTEDGHENCAVQTRYFLQQGEKHDIALLKLCKDRKKDFDLKLPGNNDSDILYPWKIFDNSTNLESRPVYKYGWCTKYTYGVIASDNYRKVIKYSGEIRSSNAEHRLDPNVNLIIGDSGREFSTNGDSGAVICDKDINENVVTAIAILHGSLYSNGKRLCTYAARLRSSFDELQRKFRIEIQPPVFCEAINNEDRPHWPHNLRFCYDQQG